VATKGGIADEPKKTPRYGGVHKKDQEEGKTSENTLFREKSGAAKKDRSSGKEKIKVSKKKLGRTIVRGGQAGGTARCPGGNSTMIAKKRIQKT